MTHLRRIMLEELQRRHYSQATTQHYIRFVERFAQHFHYFSRPPGPAAHSGVPGPTLHWCRSCRPVR